MHVRTVLLTTALLLLSAPLVFTGCKRASGSDAATPPTAAAPHIQASTPVEAGRYLVVIGGCNDCHTPGYMETSVPESEWLTGLPVGFRGPWGTTYPANLRLSVTNMTEDAWVEMVHTRTMMPPMPWVNLNQISEQDARAIYQYISSLGPAGQPAPTYVPPGQEPATPYIDFVPQHMERLQAPPPAPAPKS